LEELIGSQHGATAIIAGLIIALALNVFVKFLEIGLKIFQKKNEVTDQTKVDVMRLEYQMRDIQDKLTEVLRLKNSVGKAFRAIELIAADKWPEVRKTISEDDPFK